MMHVPKRRAAFRVVVALLTMLGALVLPAGHAAACSLAAPTVAMYTQWSEVIAIGTLEHATSDVITLKVEAYLKGAVRAPTLTIDNHTWDLSPACELSVKGSHRFPAGARVLAFLKPQRSLWGARAWLPVGGLAEAVLIIDDRRRLQSLEIRDLPLGTLGDAQAQIARVAGPPVAPDRPAAAAPQPPQSWSRWVPLALGLVTGGALLGLIVGIGRRRRCMP